MRAPFWITALLATLLALGVPIPGLAQDDGGTDTTEQTDEPGPVPGVPAPVLQTAPPPPLLGPSSLDLAQGFRTYRRGNTMVIVGGLGATAGAGVTWLGYQIFDELSDQGFAGVLVGLIFGGLFMVVGGAAFGLSVPLIDAGAGMSRKGLVRAGADELTNTPVIVSWVLLGAGGLGLLAGLAAESDVLFFAGAGCVVASAALGLVQTGINVRTRRGMPDRPPKVALVPAPVSRSPGLALVGRFP